MRTRRPLLFAIAAAAICAAGCSRPSVWVSYDLPAALPAPDPHVSWRVGEIRMAPPATQSAVELQSSSLAARAGRTVPMTPELERSMTESLGQALYARKWIASAWEERKWDSRALPASQPSVGTRECIIDATILASVRDARGARKIVQPDSATRLMTRQDVPTLVRRADVRVEFAVTYTGDERAAQMRRVGAVEVARTYDSSLDPNVRGERGLHRADDPNRIPPVEQILMGLMGECAEAFKRMIAPTRVEATIELRPASGAAADEALAAARKKDWPRAIEQFQAAVAGKPDDADLNFNLAVACEAAGRLGLAEQQYRRALELSGEAYAEARDGARRCRRVIEAREAAAAMEE